MYFSEEHVWVYLEIDGSATLGITEFAQEQLGDLVFIELPDIDTEILEYEPIGTIESVKIASDFIAPVSGRVIMVNNELEDEPELVNEQALKTWIIRIELADKSQLENLMSEEEYQSMFDR